MVKEISLWCFLEKKVFLLKMKYIKNDQMNSKFSDKYVFGNTIVIGMFGLAIGGDFRI